MHVRVEFLTYSRTDCQCPLLAEKPFEMLTDHFQTLHIWHHFFMGLSTVEGSHKIIIYGKKRLQNRGLLLPTSVCRSRRITPSVVLKIRTHTQELSLHFCQCRTSN